MRSGAMPVRRDRTSTRIQAVLSSEQGHWCKGKIVDENRPGKWLLRCDICGKLFEGDRSSSPGPWTSNESTK